MAYPLKFKPIYKRRKWGDQKLHTFFGKDIPQGTKIGESWELADVRNNRSIIANGEFAGRTLGAVIKNYPEEITGDKAFTGSLPLLIKFLDAEEHLSVKVHPDAQTCQQLGKGKSRGECWYIISAAPDAVIYKGLKAGVTRNEFAAAIERGTAGELLASVPVTPGQCHYIPAGTVHAIGAGLLIAEIQRPSNNTFRVFDWNRADDGGRTRKLHIDEALQSIHFGVCGYDLPVTTMFRLVDSEYFQVDKIARDGGSEMPLVPGLMKVLIIVWGFGTITNGEENPVEFKAGDTLLVPAYYEGAISFTCDTLYLTVTT